jgi:hypothetical protein
MKKRLKNQLIVFVVIAVLLLTLFFYFYPKITGKAIQEPPANANEIHTIGLSAEEQECMMKCMKCTSPGVNCTGNSEQCQTQCNVKKPEQTSETSCMETCVVKGCGEFDFDCQAKNQDSCEKECDMIKEPEAKSEEEQCIRDCVNLHAKGTICKPSQEGEQGNDVCKMCAQQCVHLYAGPCLDEEKLESKKKECLTCEHCYAKTIMGDSGEGWECIVGVECADASSEFGDEPGTGPGIVGKVGDAIGDFAGAIKDFFIDLFTSEDTSADSTQSSSQDELSQESQPSQE